MASVVIAEAPVSYLIDPNLLTPEVDITIGDRIVVIMHTLVVRTYNKEADKVLVPIARRAFHLRRGCLMQHLQSELHRSRDTFACIHRAFCIMNEELRPCFRDLPCSDGYWLSQNHSMVVVIRSGQVYIAGDAGVKVFLSRDGKDKELTDNVVRLRYKLNRLSTDSFLKYIEGYFHKETLTEHDSQLIVCTQHTLQHVDGDLSPVVTTRINAFGLREAAKQITGEYIDKPRTFVIVSLEEHNGTRLVAGEKQECDPKMLGWVDSLPPRGCKVELQLPKVREEDGDWEMYRSICSQVPEFARRLLKPLVDKRPQIPEPMTSCGKGYRFSPCVRSFLPGQCNVSYDPWEFDIVAKEFTAPPEWELREHVAFQWYWGELKPIFELVPSGPGLVVWPVSSPAEFLQALIQWGTEHEPLRHCQIKHVIIPIFPERRFKAMVGATDGLAFWDKNRWGEMVSLRTKDKTCKPFGFLGV